CPRLLTPTDCPAGFHRLTGERSAGRELGEQHGHECRLPGLPEARQQRGVLWKEVASPQPIATGQGTSASPDLVRVRKVKAQSRCLEWGCGWFRSWANHVAPQFVAIALHPHPDSLQLRCTFCVSLQGGACF